MNLITEKLCYIAKRGKVKPLIELCLNSFMNNSHKGYSIACVADLCQFLTYENDQETIDRMVENLRDRTDNLRSRPMVAQA